jgi:hypothetical protein
MIIVYDSINYYISGASKSVAFHKLVNFALYVNGTIICVEALAL